VFSLTEVTTRVLEVLKDAFDGRPAYLERPEGGDPTRWEGTIEGGRLLLALEGTTAVIKLTWDSGEASEVRAETYEQLASWAFALCRRRRFQRFITPRHYIQVVNEVFGLRPPAEYNPLWPHTQEVELPGGRRLVSEWDEEECRLRVSCNGDETFLDDPEEAVGWLTGLQADLETA